METRHKIDFFFLAVGICCKLHHVCTFTINLVQFGAVQSPSKLASEQKSDMRHMSRNIDCYSFYSLQASYIEPYF